MATPKATKTIREDNTGVDFVFSSGAALAVDVSAIPENVQLQLMLHGISQKIGDAYSGTKDAEEAFTFASKTAERLLSGEWKAARQGGGGGPRITQVVEALHRATGETLEACQGLVAGMEDAAVASLRKHPDIMCHLAAIKAERAVEAANKAKEESGSTEGPSLAEMLQG